VPEPLQGLNLRMVGAIKFYESETRLAQAFLRNSDSFGMVYGFFRPIPSSTLHCFSYYPVTICSMICGPQPVQLNWFIWISPAKLFGSAAGRNPADTLMI